MNVYSIIAAQYIIMNLVTFPKKEGCPKICSSTPAIFSDNRAYLAGNKITVCYWSLYINYQLDAL